MVQIRIESTIVRHVQYGIIALTHSVSFCCHEQDMSSVSINLTCNIVACNIIACNIVAVLFKLLHRFILYVYVEILL